MRAIGEIHIFIIAAAEVSLVELLFDLVELIEVKSADQILQVSGILLLQFVLKFNEFLKEHRMNLLQSLDATTMNDAFHVFFWDLFAKLLSAGNSLDALALL